MGLVAWIANDRAIESNVYIDDTFSADLADDMAYYESYGALFPTAQANTMLLWDEINLFHELPKQIWGERLTIIGFEVDPNAMTITMSDSKRAELLAGVEEFCRIPPGGRRHTLNEYQQLAGWVNWSFNVFPLLKPGLSHVYEKMKGKAWLEGRMSVSRGIINDLTWFSRHVRNSTGIHLLDSLDWDPANADMVAFCDASLEGLGIYFPEIGLGYQSRPPPVAPKDIIFYFEAFCVCWCLHEIARLVRANGKVTVRKLTIWTDNSNTFDIFNSLRALPLYNEILKSAVDVLIENRFKLRVLLLPGKKNIVADALSRWDNDKAAAHHTGLLIDGSRPLPVIPYLPPRKTLGAEEI
ncbi:hypothetical protein C8R43DRAFT_1091113 [Mycena crocata]|nr:hypothetical protein C8R43DRAFT_1091113 [Mycena crocata]